MPQTDPRQGFTGLPLYPETYQIPDTLAALYFFLLDRSIEQYPTLSALQAAIPSPTDGMVKWVTADQCAYVRRSGAWKQLRVAGDESVTVPPADFFTPASGITISSGSVEVIAGKSVVWELYLTTDAAYPLTAGGMNVSIGTVKSPYRPRTYFAPFTGWPTSGLCSGLVANGNGDTTLRWTSTSVVDANFVLGGSWPI